MTYSYRFHHAVVEIAQEVRSRIDQQPILQWNEEAMLRELTCCLLSSQVKYSDAQAFASNLAGKGLLNAPRRRGALESSILAELRQPVCIEERQRRYRFPRTRSRQLAMTLCAVEQQFGSVTNLIRAEEPRIIRELMIQHLPGIGPKQASMFLRNIGLTYELAVIDRHVLRYMEVTELDRFSELNSQSLAGYLAKESILRDYSAFIGQPVGIVDWAIWIVMRAAGGLGLT